MSLFFFDFLVYYVVMFFVFCCYDLSVLTLWVHFSPDCADTSILYNFYFCAKKSETPSQKLGVWHERTISIFSRSQALIDAPN